MDKIGKFFRLFKHNNKLIFYSINNINDFINGMIFDKDINGGLN